MAPPYPSLSAYCRLMRLDRPIGMALLLWPTLWALWVAGAGHPPYNMVLIFTLGTLVMRTAGCVINDIVDRDIDRQVARTQTRPLAKGELTCYHAYLILGVLLHLALFLWWCLPRPSQLLGLLGVLLAFIYPFFKRWTHFPQCVLGVCFGGWSTLMVFTALHVALYPKGILLFFANTLWTIVYDTFYAMSDREDDVRLGLKSTAIFLENHHPNQAYNLLAMGQMIVLLMLVALMPLGQLGIYYGIALVGVSLIMLKQQYALRMGQAEGAFHAFLMSHWIGLAVFVGLLLEYSGL